ncbi:MAG: hypothetical protein V4544_01630 [Pseudomonadota bacterium]
MSHDAKVTLGTIFTFHQAGNAMKITALCETTLIEVSVIAPTSLPQANMQLLALRKLQRMIKKQS